MPRIANCPACACPRVKIVATLDAECRERFLSYSAVKYGGLLDRCLNDLEVCIVRCASCGHHWYLEQPDESLLWEMYASARYLLQQDGVPSREPTPLINVQLRRLRRLVPQAAPTMLDYGSGFGKWAKAGAAHGFVVTAYEPSRSRASGSPASDFTLITDIARLDSAKFDVVNFEQVLEHVTDPVAVLSSARKLCKPDGFVRITVPNILRSPEGRTLWRDWPYDGRRVHSMAPFEHLHGFTPASLSAAVHRAGLRPDGSLSSWLVYPKEQLRRMAAVVAPRIGSTFLLARIIGS